jgi:NTP pyrophosphatase (non-canonical NTP hydrolase)
MDPKTYVEGVLATEATDFDGMRMRVCKASTLRLLHASMGMADESGELAKAVKAHIFYGKPLDRTNIIEEIGDVFWFCAVALETLHSSFEEAMSKNHNKLFTRYKKGFTEQEAIERNLDAERDALAQTKVPASGPDEHCDLSK